MKSNLTQTLSGTWKLAVDPENRGRDDRWFDAVRPDAQEAPVPGIIQQVFPAYHGVAWYWCHFEPALASRPNMHWQLHFHGGVDYLGEVWLNGEYLGSYEGGEGPFDLDATDALKRAGENLLAVRVLNPTEEPIDGYHLRETPHRNKVMQFKPGSGFNYGGILQPVELRLAPAVRIVDLFVRPDLHTGQVPVTVTLRNDTVEIAQCSLAAAIGPATAQGPALLDVAEGTLTLPPGETVTEIHLQVARPHLWNLDDPYLYRVNVRLLHVPSTSESAWHVEDGRIQDESTVRCGFRDFRVEKGFFRLNGKRIFVRSTHTGNHFPQGQAVAVNPDLVRRDLIMAKAAGFNMVRFIVGMALPEQLDFCDELGLLVYEECMASWCLRDSPKMAERFDRNTDAMIRRDRNHASVTIWGLLNETPDGPVFRHAVGCLPWARQLDPTRLILLASGRWDCQWSIGSVSNPGGEAWEHAWGAEAPGAAQAEYDNIWKADGSPGAYFGGAGDAHVYPITPQTGATDRFIRTLGQGTKPVFLSEYGIGSQMNVLRETRQFEQARTRPDLFDVTFIRAVADRFVADWRRWGFDGVYAFPEDMLWDSQRLMTRQRRLGFDLVRSNPQICGYNVTGILDHGITGEGLWTFHREWKPGIAEVLCDGWAPLRWSLFVDLLHGYTGQPLHVEAVLANEDVLPPGIYPCTFRIIGPRGITWEKRLELHLPEPPPGGEAPLAVPVLSEDLVLDAPAGVYEFAAYIERGAAPAGGRLRFYLSDAAALPRIQAPVTLWGIEPTMVAWLAARGAVLRPFATAAPDGRETILVGVPPENERNAAYWTELARRMATGSAVIFLSPAAFARGEDALAWLPLAIKGRCPRFHDWLYHKECVAKAHPFFAGLQAHGIMDWDYYGQMIPHAMYDGQPAPDDVAAAAFAPCALNTEGYASGILLGSYRFAAGRFTLNVFPITELLDRHPTADRLLVNLMNDGAAFASQPLAALPERFSEVLETIGYFR